MKILGRPTGPAPAFAGLRSRIWPLPVVLMVLLSFTVLSSPAQAASRPSPVTISTEIPLSPQECSALSAMNPAVNPEHCSATARTTIDGPLQLLKGSETASTSGSYSCHDTGKLSFYCAFSAYTTCFTTWEVTGYTELQGPFTLWYSRVNVRAKWTMCLAGSETVSYSGGYVDCNHYGGTGFKVSIDWCGHANDGTESFDWGDDFHVDAFFHGFPISAPHYYRVNLDSGGNLTGQGG